VTAIVPHTRNQLREARIAVSYLAVGKCCLDARG